LHKIKQLVMSILNKITPTPVADEHKLTQKELEFLLFMIKEVSFKGENVEELYNILVKLQKQYLSLNK
tara:strand:+ start:446 stop:649 length:204 start_codon:yes stop_codon:yes gene_type:complete